MVKRWSSNGRTKDYIEMDRHEFYIDNENAVRFYFALNSAIRKCKKAQKVDDVDEGTKEPVKGEPRYILAIIDDQSEYVDVLTFTNYKEMEKAFNEGYFCDEDERKEWDEYYKEQCKKESEVK